MSLQAFSVYQFVLFLAFFLLFATVLNLYYDYQRRLKLMRRVHTEYEQEKLKGIFGILKPFLQDVVEMMHGFPRGREMLRGKNKQYLKMLARAGNPGMLTGEELYMLKFVAPLVSLVLMAIVLQGDWVIIVGVMGFFYIAPEMWIGGMVARRMALMKRVLPDAMDSIALIMRAGLDLSQAIEVYVNGKDQNILKTEFGVLQSEMRVGKTRMEALEDMANRIGLPELINLSTAVTQAEKSGISVTDYLAQQADELRMDRFRRAEEAGQKAPLKMLMPLMLFIMPGVFAVIFGPMLISFFK
tara:strand:+ start:49281 stop:50177 length:897 start_codon:yes stop_codon:yes gene_type:complete